MATRKHSIQDLKEQLQQVKHKTPWEDVKVGEEYHIPPIITLERRDIKILSKTNTEARYKRIDGTDNTESKIHKSSVFARFLVKRKPY